MRKTCLEMVHRLAREDERVVFVGSDLGPDVMAAMRKEMPERCFMEGISEAAVIGMAAGLALDGYLPYVNTIATFITRRAFEQVALDVCLHRLPVRFIANGGGTVYAPLGPTHVAHDDIALMRALPDMTVVAPCDADEMTRLMHATLDWPAPIYIRLAKGGDTIVSRTEHGFAIGQGISLVSHESADVLLVSTGILAQECIEAAGLLQKTSQNARVLHLPTVKPLDENALVREARDVALVLVAEEHSSIGGLGSAVLECLNRNLGIGGSPRIHLANLGDQFCSTYGSQRDQLKTAKLQSDQIAATATHYLSKT